MLKESSIPRQKKELFRDAASWRSHLKIEMVACVYKKSEELNHKEEEFIFC